MRFEFIRDEKAHYSVVALCRTLQVSTSGFYSWCKRKPSKRQLRQEQLIQEVEAVHEDSRNTYGSPRVCRQLHRQGEAVSEKTVAKIMRNEGLVARKRKKFKATTDSKHTKRIAPNLLKRDFNVTEPNSVWVTDVTAVWTYEGWVYLAVMLDLYSRRVVGWEMSPNNDTALALAALNAAIELRGPQRDLIHHSDRGSPYASDSYIERLADCQISRSMSRKGDCWDNAVAESFFSTLEHESRRVNSFATRSIAKIIIGDYIDNFYNPKRLHSKLNYVSPIEFELATTGDLKAA